MTTAGRQIGFWVLLSALVVGGAAAAWHWRPLPSVDKLRSLANRGSLADARNGLERRLRKNRNDEEALMLLVDMHAKLGRPDLAIGKLEELAPGSRRWAEAAYRMGELHWDLKHASKAETAWRSLEPAENSNHPTGGGGSQWRYWAWARLVDLYLLEDRNEEANAMLWRLFGTMDKRLPAAVDFLLKITRSPLGSENPQSAADTLSEFAAADPDDVRVACALALYRLRLNQASEARQQLTALLAAHPDQAVVWESWLKFLTESGDAAGLRKAIKQLPTDILPVARLVYFRAIDHQLHGEFAQAVAGFRECLAKNARDLAVRSRLAQALRLAGEKVEAEKQSVIARTLSERTAELSQASGSVGKFPGNNLSYAKFREYAKLCEELGWKDEAVAWYGLATLRWPDDDEVLQAARRLTGVANPSR